MVAGAPARRHHRTVACALLWAAVIAGGPELEAQAGGVTAAGDSVEIRFTDADLRAVIQALGKYLDRPIVFGALPQLRVSFETPGPVPRDAVPELARGLVEANGLTFERDSLFIRIVPRARSAEHGAGRNGGQDAPVLLHVVRLKHARAPDVAATLNSLFGGTGEFSGSRALPETLSGGLEANRMRPQPAEVGQAAPSAGQGQAILRGPSVVVPDQLTNSLLIRATEEDFAVLESAIEQLDIRPLQVLVEVLIVEARSDQSFSLSSDLFVPPQDLGEGGSIGGTLTGGAAPGGLGDLVIRLLNVTKSNIDATLRFQQSKGNVEIVSRPVLVTANNTQASFLVGTQRPFVQVSRSLPTDTPSRDQVIQYRDVGTKLTVLPTINQDGYVSLFVQQEINQATTEVQFDAPVIATREAVTQVLVKDGQTIVLGGIRDRQRDRVQLGVPILSGIPIIGGLFGSASRRSSGTELYIFLTPRILATDEDIDRVTRPVVPDEDVGAGTSVSDSTETDPRDG